MARWDAPPSFTDYASARYGDLLRFAHVLTGDPHLAADLVQDALERVGMSWHRIQRRDDPEGYVRRVITNRFLNRVRSLRRERLVADVPETAYTPADPSDRSLWALLTTLPPRQRAVIVLRYYLDLSEAETADVLGCSVGTVKSNGSRAMAKLRSSLASQSTMEGVR